MRIFFKGKRSGMDGRPMGFTGQDMERPGGRIATREQQQQWMNALFDCIYKTHGSITLNELRVMLCIVEAHDRGNPMALSDVGYHLGIPITTVSRIVSQLIKRGKITAQGLASDRRKKILLATPELLERRMKALATLTKVTAKIWGWRSLRSPA